MMTKDVRPVVTEALTSKLRYLNKKDKFSIEYLYNVGNASLKDKTKVKKKIKLYLLVLLHRPSAASDEKFPF